MKVLLDTNIVLDYILERSQFIENARKMMQLSYDEKIIAYVSASSVTDIYYIVRKLKSKNEALDFLIELLSFVNVAGVDKTVIIRAIKSNFSDFEDAVQNFTAVNSGIDIFVTRNTKDYKNSQLKILNPIQFIEYMQNAE